MTVTQAELKGIKAGDWVWYEGQKGPHRWCRVQRIYFSHFSQESVVTLKSDMYFLNISGWSVNRSHISLNAPRLQKVTYT